MGLGTAGPGNPLPAGTPVYHGHIWPLLYGLTGPVRPRSACREEDTEVLRTDWRSRGQEECFAVDHGRGNCCAQGATASFSRSRVGESHCTREQETAKVCELPLLPAKRVPDAFKPALILFDLLTALLGEIGEKFALPVVQAARGHDANGNVLVAAHPGARVG